MNNTIIISDFDGTITKKDTLVLFLEKYAPVKWVDIENDWKNKKIGSQECLKRQFGLIPCLTEHLIDNFLNDIEIDDYFKIFCDKLKQHNIPIIVLSDGLDYFIDKILKKYDIYYPQIVTNHAYFKNNQFIIDFPNSSKHCKNNAGTCKCNIVNKLKQEYENIIYIGDGTSDFCVAKSANTLYAKSSLRDFCISNNINHIAYNTYNDIIQNIAL